MKNTALITGSSKGIGRELSLLLLQRAILYLDILEQIALRIKTFILIE